MLCFYSTYVFYSWICFNKFTLVLIFYFSYKKVLD
uniref:Uncharacterized protein n=1 Tax=Populus trichocarpa TaxID=3694 RepID=A0A3N7ETV9_POPTR